MEKHITKKEAEKVLGTSLDFYAKFVDRGNRLFLVENQVGAQMYGIVAVKGSPTGVLETTLKNHDQIKDWAKANDIPPGDLMSDASILETYPQIVF